MVPLLVPNVVPLDPVVFELVEECVVPDVPVVLVECELEPELPEVACVVPLEVVVVMWMPVVPLVPVVVVLLLVLLAPLLPVEALATCLGTH